MPDDVISTSTVSEASRRWPDFQGGRAIVLPDGQAWTFYESEAVLRDGKPGWTFGPDVPADVDAILSSRFHRIVEKWGRAGNDADRASAMLEAAWFLLARNYALKQDEFEAILARAGERLADEQEALGRALLVLVGIACTRASSLAETA